MPSPKRSRIERVSIQSAGGNPHLREPMKASEQKRMTKKAGQKLSGK